MKAYKIMKVSDQEKSWKTLFHGVDGDRNIKCNQWIVANSDYVRDGSGGTYYMSGWHVLPSYKDALKYMENFKDPTDKYIETSLFGNEFIENGDIVGANRPHITGIGREFFAKVTMQDGIIAKVS